MEAYKFAWLMYTLGSVGCGIAAWLLFRRFGREWSIFFCTTVLALLLTPYAINAKDMTMAPALFVAVFEGLTQGIETIKPVIKVLLGVWLLALVVSLLCLLAARRYGHPNDSGYAQPTPAEHYPGDDEQATHDEVLADEVPLRAFR